MDQNQWVRDNVGLDNLGPDAQWAVIDWVVANFGSAPCNNLPGLEFQPGLATTNQEFVFLIENDGRFDDPLIHVGIIYNGFLDFCFVFRGKIEAIHLSRSGKSVIVIGEEPRYLNGEPWIVYQRRRFILTLDGSVRNA